LPEREKGGQGIISSVGWGVFSAALKRSPPGGEVMESSSGTYKGTLKCKNTDPRKGMMYPNAKENFLLARGGSVGRTRILP